MSNNQALKQAYVETINQFSPRLTHAITVTFKTRAYVLPKSYEKCTQNTNNALHCYQYHWLKKQPYCHLPYL